MKPRQWHETDDAVWVRDEERELDSWQGTWKGLYQRVKVMELVPVYEDMINGRFSRFWVGDDGISQAG